MFPHYLRNRLPWPAPFSNPVRRSQRRPQLREAWNEASVAPTLAAVSDAPVVSAQTGVEREPWQDRAIDTYEHVLPLRRAGLTATLTDRLLALTGTMVPREKVFVDAAGQLAVVRIEDVTFRMDQYGYLIVPHGCAWCGTAQFESPRIAGPESLGFALGHWTPLHEGCNDEDPSED